MSQQEETVLEQRLSQKELKITLQPYAIELISRQDFRRLVKDYEQRGYPTEVTEIFNNARKIIYQTAFIAFIAGKNQAAREVKIQFWSIEENDMNTVTQLRLKYYHAFEEVFRDLTTAIRLKDPEAVKIVNRCDQVLQMLTWSAYNKGKLALWDDEILKPQVFQAQRYKYEGKWTLKTAADDDVCNICAPWAGVLVDDPHELPECPEATHPWCRCTPVAIPTVKVFEKQERFRERWEEEQYEDYLRSLEEEQLGLEEW